MTTTTAHRDGNACKQPPQQELLQKARLGTYQRTRSLRVRGDPAVTLEEYIYWAKVERDMELVEWKRHRHLQKNTNSSTLLKHILRSKDSLYCPSLAPKAIRNSSTGIAASDFTDPHLESDVHDDADRHTIARAMRTISWSSVMFLITTDILGWAQTPYAFSNDGYGLGAGIFVLMGAAAGLGSWFIWRIFLALDSSKFPIVNYGDPFLRLVGRNFRHFVNTAQALQIFFEVGIVQLSLTSVIAQLGASADLCFVACGIIFLVVCMPTGYIRSLRHISWLCHICVWLNVVCFIIICIAAPLSGPDVVASVNYGILPKAWLTEPAPVKTFVGVPTNPYQPTNSNLFAAKFNGINCVIYAYTGATFFFAFLSEMRYPRDFLKAAWGAQLFITLVYLFFGLFAYSFYGQYSYPSINQVVRPLGAQIAVNVLTLITGWVMAALYFHVGMKMLYVQIGQEMFGLPPITEKAGRRFWWALGPIYWIVAFVVAMSVPQFTTFTNLIGAIFGNNFTYTLPSLMYLALKIHEGAKLPGEGFDPATGITTRHDFGPRRYIRGFLKNWTITVPTLLLGLGGLAASGMGTWAAILGLESAFGAGGSVLTSWTCVNPFYTKS